MERSCHIQKTAWGVLFAHSLCCPPCATPRSATQCSLGITHRSQCPLLLMVGHIRCVILAVYNKPHGGYYPHAACHLPALPACEATQYLLCIMHRSQCLLLLMVGHIHCVILAVYKKPHVGYYPICGLPLTRATSVRGYAILPLHKASLLMLPLPIDGLNCSDTHNRIQKSCMG